MTDTKLIKDRLDIVQLIQEYLPLKKAGANWKANCPFHNEKSPSFMVHQEKQIWHCFGCSKGGDIFTFIQEMEGLDFPEALKLLAGRAGIALEYTPASEINQSQRNRLLEINEAAAYFWHRFFLDIPGSSAARDYLQRRGLTLETIKEWRVGFAPDQWELGTKYLLKKGFAINDLVASGLTIQRAGANLASGRGFYDRFRGRIMFPIGDVHGSVVGFTGRILVETADSGGKYVNTPETPLYNKSRVIYGLHLAKQAIKTAGEAVLVEGQMDVLSCHQAGMKNVVAVSGTALTPEQLKLLKRYATRLLMAFDADSAGQSAGARGADAALAAGFEVRVIRLDPLLAKDADEYLRTNPSAWFTAVAKAEDVMQWYLVNIFIREPPLEPRARQRAMMLFLEKVSLIPFALEREHWLKKMCDILGIEINLAREEFHRLKRTPPRSQ